MNRRQRRGTKVTAGLLLMQVGVILALIAALACGSVDEPAAPGSGGDPSAVTVAPTLEPAADLPTAAVGEAATPLPTAAMSATAEPLPPATGLPVSRESLVMTVTADEADEARAKYERVLNADWATDFTRTTISYDEILTGGPPKDGIPSIDDPQFESIADANDWLNDLEPVQVVDINGDVRAYPVQVMVWHELVNDTVGGEPVVITF